MLLRLVLLVHTVLFTHIAPCVQSLILTNLPWLPNPQLCHIRRQQNHTDNNWHGYEELTHEEPKD